MTGPASTLAPSRPPGWILAAAPVGGAALDEDSGLSEPAGPVCADDAPWASVSAGAALSCGIRGGGYVECWGRAGWGYHEYEGATPETDQIDYGGLDVPDLALASLAHLRGPTGEGRDQHARGPTPTGDLADECDRVNDRVEAEAIPDPCGG